jgi:hypothetical protein
LHSLGQLPLAVALLTQWLLFQTAGIAGGDATSFINLPALRDALYAAEWDMSPFSTPIVLHALMLLGGAQTDPVKFNEALSVVIDNRLQMGMHGRRYTNSINNDLFIQCVITAVV